MHTLNGREAANTSPGVLVLRGKSHTEVFRTTSSGVEQSWVFAAEPAGTDDLVVRVSVDGMTYAGSGPNGLLFADAGRHIQYSHATWVDASGARTGIEATWQDSQIEIRVPSTVLERSAYPAVLDPTISEPLNLGMLDYGEDGERADDPHIAFDGTNYWVAWTVDGPARRVARVSEAGEVLDVVPLAVSGGLSGFQLACAVGSCAAVWSEAGRVYFRWLREVAGAIAAGPPLQVETGDATSLTSDGTHFLVTWSAGPSARLLDQDGVAVSDPVQLPAGSDHGLHFAAAYGDGHYLVAWASATQAAAARVTQAGALADVSALVLGPRSALQHHVSVAYAASEFVVAWDTVGNREYHSQSWSGVPYSVNLVEIRGRRVSPDGTLDAAPTMLVGPPWSHVFEPSLTSTADGSISMLWMARTAELQQSTIDEYPYIASVATGAALSTGVPREFDVGSRGRVAQGATTRLVVHLHGSPYLAERLYGHLLTPTTLDAGEPFPIPVTLVSQSNAQWVRGGDTHLAVWRQPRALALPVSSDGTPLQEPSTGTPLPGTPRFAVHDGSAFHLWFHFFSPSLQNVYLRMAEDGTVLAQHPYETGILAAAFDGERVRVLLSVGSVDEGTRALVVSSIQPDGTPSSTGNLRIPITGYDTGREVALAADGDRLLLAYSTDNRHTEVVLIERNGSTLSVLASHQSTLSGEYGGLSVERAHGEFWVMGPTRMQRVSRDGALIGDTIPIESTLRHAVWDGRQLWGVVAGRLSAHRLSPAGMLAEVFFQDLDISPTPQSPDLIVLGGSMLGMVDSSSTHGSTELTRARIVTISPACGDGLQQGDEMCDLGELASNSLANTCREDCTLPRCGDGVVDIGEGCDEGGPTATCTALCALDTCGDGALQEGEACDDAEGNANTADTCRVNCTLPVCGDGIVDTGEACDDGQRNRAEWDACQPDCTLPRCGDGVVGPGEACDTGDLGNAPDQCRSDCSRPSCGDGVVDSSEECDWAVSPPTARTCRTTCYWAPYPMDGGVSGADAGTDGGTDGGIDAGIDAGIEGGVRGGSRCHASPGETSSSPTLAALLLGLVTLVRRRSSRSSTKQYEHAGESSP
ncbi:MAG: hypothetical protein KC668_24205 [Myxococcales bacterium]|nr:hypothetical protein [Myxococcales bacterium]